MPAIKKYPTKYCNNCGDPTVEKDCRYKKRNSIVLTLCHKCNKVISGLEVNPDNESTKLSNAFQHKPSLRKAYARKD